MYSNQVKNHFSNPRNVGELDFPDAVGRAKNEADGDQVLLHLQISDNLITDVRMKVMGCVAAIAATSQYSEMIKGLSIDDALSINKEQLTNALEGLPPNKVRCSLTCIDALHEAINMYRKGATE